MAQDVKEYWVGKEQRAELAKQHTITMDLKYPEEINKSVEKTKVYTEPFNKEVNGNKMPVIDIIDTDTVTAIFKHKKQGEKIAALNFASYKHPGGGFMKGSSAQEESVCHESNLYNVISQFESGFYAENNKDKNKALYKDRGLYSPDIVFERGNRQTLCDVITCASPNKKAAQKYCYVSDHKNYEALESRIKFVLDMAEENNIDVIILGAYGCGVFGQDPIEVANLFKQELMGRNFKKAIFAIPKGKNGNYDAFRRVFILGVKK